MLAIIGCICYFGDISSNRLVRRFIIHIEPDMPFANHFPYTSLTIRAHELRKHLELVLRELHLGGPEVRAYALCVVALRDGHVPESEQPGEDKLRSSKGTGVGDGVDLTGLCPSLLILKRGGG